MPELTREFFQKQGKRGGQLGGAMSWDKLTPEERSARAQHAVSKRKWHPPKPPKKEAVQAGKARAKAQPKTATPRKTKKAPPQRGKAALRGGILRSQK